LLDENGRIPALPRVRSPAPAITEKGLISQETTTKKMTVIHGSVTDAVAWNAATFQALA
jgi:hypothetical protein